MQNRLISKLMPIFLLGIMLVLFVFINAYSSLLVLKLTQLNNQGSESTSSSHIKTTLSPNAVESLLDLKVVMFEEVGDVYVYYCVSPYFPKFRKNHNINFNVMLSRSKNGTFVGFPTLSGSY